MIRALANHFYSLDSRQRKKKHTESLEEEKKFFTERVQALEDELKALQNQFNAMALEKEELVQTTISLNQQVEALTWDKENLVRDHTIETGDLRKKIGVLAEKLDSSTNMMPSHSSIEFNEFTNEVNDLSMGPSLPDWDNYIWVDDELDPREARHTQPKTQPTQTTLVLNRRPKDAVVSTDSDKPLASGLPGLLTILLCGAFVVASKSSGKAAPPIPSMPQGVQEASATILQDMLKGPEAPQHSLALRPSAVTGMEPRPSGNSWLQPDNKPPLVDDNDFPIGVTPGPLDALSSTLFKPTKDQEAEAIFSMTPAQYNSLTTADFTRRVYSVSPDDDSALSPPSSVGGGRKHLAETLKAMREESGRSGVAEVYTRSLLLDKIPTDVLREFKKMAKERALIEADGADVRD